MRGFVRGNSLTWLSLVLIPVAKFRSCGVSWIRESRLRGGVIWNELEGSGVIPDRALNCGRSIWIPSDWALRILPRRDKVSHGAHVMNIYQRGLSRGYVGLERGSNAYWRKLNMLMPWMCDSSRLVRYKCFDKSFVLKARPTSTKKHLRATESSFWK
jgi:hypothetical protein